METLVPNITRAPLSDLRVRRAIAHAIDKQFLVDKLLFGQGVTATGPVSHTLARAYNPNVDKYEDNLALANQLLDEAGHRRTSDGTRFHLKFPAVPFVLPYLIGLILLRRIGEPRAEEILPRAVFLM